MSAIQTLIFPRMGWGVDALQASKLMHLALSKFKCYRRWLNELMFLCFSVSDFRLVDPRGDPFLVQVAHFPLQLPDYIFWFASWRDSAICNGCSFGLYIVLVHHVTLYELLGLVVVSFSWQCTISLCIYLYIFG